MNKKLIFILFLIAIFFISCSNENKTGSTSNDIGTKYIGDWTFTCPIIDGAILTINADGSCVMKNITSESVTKNSDNNYVIVLKNNSNPDYTLILTLDVTFDTETSGTVKGSQKAVSPRGEIIDEYNDNFEGTITRNK